MKCYVCGKEYDFNSAAACPRCGFASFLVTEESPEMQAAIAQMVEEYRKELLGGCQVFIKAYAYEKTANGLDARGEQRILVAEPLKLVQNELTWSETAFGVSDTLVLEAELEKDGKVYPYSFEMQPPKQTGKWKVGAILADELKLFLVVGGEEDKALSAPIDLLPSKG